MTADHLIYFTDQAAAFAATRANADKPEPKKPPMNGDSNEAASNVRALVEAANRLG